MKTNFLYVGMAVVFAVLVIIYATTTSNLSEEIASISENKPVAVKEELVVRFPINLEFQRPEALNKVRFTQVKFSHFDHQDVNCVKCHHTWDGKSQIKGCAAPGCHDNIKHKAKPNSYFKAFHTLSSDISCRGCHVKMNKEGQTDIATAPCANNACHPKVDRPHN